MPIFQIIGKIIKILRSDGTPVQIAVGFSMGMMAGFIPFDTLHVILIWLGVIIFNVSFGAFLFGWIIFSGFAYLFDPLFHDLGYKILVDLSFLKGFFTWLSNTSILALTRFNNTVVMGSTILSILLFVPLFFFIKYFVIYYREHIDAKIQKWKIIQSIKASKLYKTYEKIKGWSEL
ncbi:MAG: hypothetical protein Kow00108_21570 [Calditrichia bacterium]